MRDFESSELKKSKAIAALLTKSTIAQAAEEAGISEATLYRFLNETAFQDRLRQAESDLLAQTTRRLAGLLTKAVDRLETLIDEGDTDAVRLRACLAILDKYLVAHDTVALQAQIDEIKRLLPHEKPNLFPVS
jgi:hypothetical protein